MSGNDIAISPSIVEENTKYYSSVGLAFVSTVQTDVGLALSSHVEIASAAYIGSLWKAWKGCG